MHKTAGSLIIGLFLIVSFAYSPQGFTQNNTSSSIDSNPSTPDLIPYAQEKLGQFENAIVGYLQLIEQIEAKEGLFSPALIQPLLGLSRSYLGLKELEAAQESAARAQHLQHRNDGVLSLEQLAVVELKTRIHLLQGAPEKADKQQRFAHYLVERNYGTDSPDTLPATYKLIDWYAATGQYHKAQRLLTATIKSFSEMDSEQPAILPALLRSSRLRRLRGIAGQHKHLERALAVITDNQDIPEARQNEVYLALADAYLIGNRFVDAQKYYQITWDNLPEDQRAIQFSEPRELALSNQLDESRSGRRSEFEVQRISRLNSNSRDYRPFDRDNELKLSTPQKLVLPFQEDDYAVLFNQNSTDPTAARTLKVVGSPFRFVRDQLVDFLPRKLSSDEGLATISILMEFSVNAEGRTHNIEVSSEQATGRLLRTMRRILSKTRFRPRLLDGKPVTTHEVQLTQTFLQPAT